MVSGTNISHLQLIHVFGLLSVTLLIANGKIVFGQGAEDLALQSQPNLFDESLFAGLITNELRKVALFFAPRSAGSSSKPAWLSTLLSQLKNEAAQSLSATVSPACAQSLEQLFEGMKATGAGAENSTWALKFLDATGKIGSSYVEGNQQVIGSFAECIDISSDEASPLQSRYCTTRLGPKPSATASNREIVAPATGLSIGTCLPEKCTANDTEMLFLALLSLTANHIEQLENVTVLKVHCDSRVDSEQLNGRAIVAVAILAVGGFLLVAGTLLDAVLRCIDSRQNSLPIRILLCWSALRNGNKILAVEPTKPVRSGTDDAANSPPPPLNSVHGIRFLAMCWVIYCHAFVISVGSLKDPARFLNDVGKWYFQPLANAGFAVDTFFFLSGLLLAYVVTAQQARGRKINWIQYYVHRYWRLTPPYMLTLAVIAGLFRYVTWGPLSNPDAYFPQQCENSWWANLLYVNNFFRVDRSCMTWTWYLPNDMQFYMISPVFIIPFLRRKSYGIAAWCLLMLAHIAVTVWIAVEHKLPGSFMATGRDPENHALFWTFYTAFYIKPWTRIGPYLVGVAFGYILYQVKTKQHWRLRAWQTAAGWVLVLGASIAIIFPLADENGGRGRLSLVAATFYNAFSRPIWGAILGFVIFTCETGSGGFINTVLCFPGFVPFSRLSYCAYLVHPAIMLYIYGEATSQIGYSVGMLTILAFGFILASYCLAFIISLLFESPALELEKLTTLMLSKKPQGVNRSNESFGNKIENVKAKRL